MKRIAGGRIPETPISCGPCGILIRIGPAICSLRRVLFYFVTLVLAPGQLSSDCSGEFQGDTSASPCRFAGLPSCTPADSIWMAGSNRQAQLQGAIEADGAKR